MSLGIPISFLGTFWLMPTLDVSISMISLFAFIVVLGIVVDDAILIGENIHAHHEQGTPGLKGAIAGAIEMAKLGFSYEQILNHYYRDAKVKKIEILSQ